MIESSAAAMDSKRSALPDHPDENAAEAWLLRVRAYAFWRPITPVSVDDEIARLAGQRPRRYDVPLGGMDNPPPLSVVTLKTTGDVL